MACAAGEGYCTGFDRRRVCDGAGFTDEVCPPGSGCVRGQCVPARCSDECTLGKSKDGKVCEAWDMEAGAFVPLAPGLSLHDRAREYLRWLQKDGLAYGGVGDPIYADPPAYTTRVGMNGLGDSALWTGTYLASEALRLLATGAADAREHVAAEVRTLHLWFNVSPSPGVLARFVRPAGASDPPDAIDCNKNTHHCDVPYDGKRWDYNGHVSRDQYQGVMLGYALAYDALSPEDEPLRKMIRDDVLTLVRELMKEREIDLEIIYNGTTYPRAKIKARFAVVVEEELVDGVAAQLTYSGGQGTWRGFQEFIPNLAPILKQIPILGLIAPSTIPRDSSAIMLASFFRLALHVTEGIPEHAAERATIESFYLSNTGSGGNVHDWIPIAQQWSRAGDDCGANYYANNISMQPLYNWARLEKDPTVLSAARGIVADKTWPAFLNHKNTFFTFLSGANMTGPDAGAISAARDQLAQFPVPPYVRRAFDHRANPAFMPHEASCTDKANKATAVDVGVRAHDGFMWQRDPWQLYDEGNPAQVFAGVDYLVAYWLGRHHGFIEEDAASTCLRWK